MHARLIQNKPLFETVMEHLQKELGALRTGRATPALIEDVRVHAYDGMMELKGLASIGVSDAKTLLIDPWDKALIPAIEKAIRDSGTGLSPATDGGKIRIVLPPMTEENRIKLVKLMKEKIEESRIAIRSVREELREEIQESEKNKEMSEDEKFKLLDELDK
ncbi:MAG: ribosome recycling factor, partial [Patescibacteria group bacterium]